MNANKRDAVRSSIAVAFGGLPIPTGDLVHENSHDPREREAVEQVFTGRHWSDVSTHTICANPQILLFLNPISYRYYVVAFLLTVLDCFEQSGDILPIVTFTLAGRADSRIDAFVQARVSTFDLQQRRALSLFYDWVCACHPDEIDDDELKRLRESLG